MEDYPATPRTEPSAKGAPDQPLLVVSNLRVRFPVRSGMLQRTVDHVDAVAGVSFVVDRGETLGLVGESGSGKTTVGRAILRLVPHWAKVTGTVHFEGQDVLAARPRPLKSLRRQMQVVFQDPASSLNPRMTVGQAIAEPLVIHSVASKRDDLRHRVDELLVRCGMPREAADKYPHEFSGGQRQRIVIARALALSPRFIVCDEPTSALDVSIQAQIINLLMDLQRDLGLAYLFISHDISVIQHVCKRVAVMHQGRLVELGDRDQVLDQPAHDYTKALLAAVPVAKPSRSPRPAAFPAGIGAQG